MNKRGGEGLGPGKGCGSFRSRLSQVVRNERPESKPPGSREADPTPSHHGFDTTGSQSEQAGSTSCARGSTRPAPSSQAGSTNFTTSKPVEPGREERTTRVETTRPQPPRFRHDQLLRRRPAQPTSPPPNRLSRVVRNERPESKPPDPSHHGFDTTSSFVAGRNVRFREVTFSR